MNFDSILLIVSDLDAAVLFYSETLGLRLTEHFPGDYAAFHTDQGVTLALHVPHDGHTHAVAAAGLELSFTVADLDAKVSALRTEGVQFLRPPTDMPWGAREAQLIDPDGHVLTLKQATAHHA
jgi:catechol 2,3-dioxygenase-like lactoylglutathione lyase family enzyme